MPSVQGCVEEALSRILAHQTSLLASGRTDAGVHALKQIAVFRTSVKRRAEEIRKGLNALLPKSIRVLSVRTVSEDFHPQFAAKKKIYRYLVQNSAVVNPLLSPYIYFFPEKLCLKRMQEAANLLVGKHDFSAFQGSRRRAKDAVRTIYRLKVARLRDPLFGTQGLIGFTLVADGFLHKMVRNIVGTLIAVGRRKIEPHQVKAILESRDRRKAGPTVPARGLTLMDVNYRNDYKRGRAA